MTPNELKTDIENILLQINRLSNLARELVDGNLKDVPAHPAYFAINRAWHELNDAAASLDRTQLRKAKE